MWASRSKSSVFKPNSSSSYRRDKEWPSVLWKLCSKELIRAAIENLTRLSSRLHSTISGKIISGLTVYGRLFPKVVEVQALLKYYDKNGDGSISFEEFIDGLREPLNERRKKICRKAFTSVASGDKILAAHFFGRYNAINHPQFKSGKKTIE